MPKKAALPEPDARPAPDAEEQVAIKASFERYFATPAPVSIAWAKDRAAIRSPHHSDDVGHSVQLMEALGTRSNDSYATAVGDLDYASRHRGTERGESATAVNASLALVAAIAPKNELEAALACQMAGCHVAAMEMLGRARQTDRTDHIALYGGLAVKLQRTFTAQVEALAKLRGGGKQQVEVRHVYVNGNAVIGDVHAGGGGDAERGNQPHATALAYAPGEAVRSPFAAERETVPVASGERQSAV